MKIDSNSEGRHYFTEKCSFSDCTWTQADICLVYTPENTSIRCMCFVIGSRKFSVQNKSGPVGSKPALTFTKRWHSSLSYLLSQVCPLLLWGLKPQFWGVMEQISTTNHQSASVQACSPRSEQTVRPLNKPHILGIGNCSWDNLKK